MEIVIGIVLVAVPIIFLCLIIDYDRTMELIKDLLGWFFMLSCVIAFLLGIGILIGWW